jgi:DNA anti-recombination protein RmuC
MIRIALSLAVLLLLAGPALPVAAQEQQVNKAEESRDKEQYEQSMKERLGKLGAQLDEVKKEAEKSSAQMKEKMKQRLAEAEKKRQEAERKLKELGQASKETWQKFSTEVEKAAREFERAFERVMKEK